MDNGSSTDDDHHDPQANDSPSTCALKAHEVHDSSLGDSPIKLAQFDLRKVVLL